MVKAAWSEVTATCVRNCFRKAGFVDTQPEAEPDASDGQSGGDLWQRVIDSDMGAMTSAGTISFVPMKMLTLRNRARTRASLMKCGARAMRRNRTGDDETSEPAPISAPVAMGYIEDLKQLVYAKGLGEEHAAALNKLETALIKSALQKQTTITDLFAKKNKCASTSVFFFY
ncbi:hypothetical protein HPB48_001456 [Haemaphysalis longicornis]|uniref:Uncharacterized protein n=1 Tax=Haemaphysalis longicornis TaxID=44386 RepID=A0A9J6FF30_HAELO|nr:hypothetical protein HPB48_001456 [Haemaphysalis longicornis]